MHIPCTYMPAYAMHTPYTYIYHAHTHTHIPSYTHTYASCTYVYARYTYACTHMRTTGIPCTHIPCTYMPIHTHTCTMLTELFFKLWNLVPEMWRPRWASPHGEWEQPWSPIGVDLGHGKKSHDGEARLDLAKWHAFNCVCVCIHAIIQLTAVCALLPCRELKGWTQVFQLSRLPGPVVQYCFSGGIGA